MVVNMNMRGSGEGNINQYLADTISYVFGEVYTVEVSGSTNRELFASDNKEMISSLEEGVARLEEGNLQAMMERTAGNLVRYEAGDYILTDDRAPVELLGMQVIDELIGDEVAYYKEIYEAEGIEGLLRSF